MGRVYSGLLKLRCWNKVLSWVKMSFVQRFLSVEPCECIWVRGGGGPGDPLSTKIWALHLHIARTTIYLHEGTMVSVNNAYWTIAQLYGCKHVYMYTYCILQSTFANLSALHWLFASHLDVAHPTSCVHNLKLLIVLWLVPYWGVLLLYIWAFEHQHRP